MTDLTKLCKIYIIESQKPIDLLENRAEGKALSSGLELAGIASQYYQVINNDCLDKSLSIIADDMNKLKSNGLVAPFIHISAHGNENGIALTSGEFINWESFSNKVDRLIEKTGRLQPIRENPLFQISLISYCFSSCKGFNAYKIQGESKENKFSSIIGPTDEVAWSDSLVAYMTFYHQVFYKKNKGANAIEIMNKSAGLNEIFKIKLGVGLPIKI